MQTAGISLRAIQQNPVARTVAEANRRMGLNRQPFIVNPVRRGDSEAILDDPVSDRDRGPNDHMALHRTL